jgi:NADPH:quinone reductase-like Zn-dependent oxidoreductase
MKAARIHEFGPPNVVVIDDVPCPSPLPGEVLVRIAAAGVGSWDAKVREKKISVSSPLPIILGSDFAGTIESVGAAVSQFKPGDEVYGVTGKDLCGAHAEYAVAPAAMVAIKPKLLDFIQAASVPAVAVTAWQMLCDYAKLKAGQAVLIHGAAGNVGGFAMQLAKLANLEIYATARSSDQAYVCSLGAHTVIDYEATRFEDSVPPVNAVIDTVGGDTGKRSFDVLKPDGILVSVVSPFPQEPPQPFGRRSAFFLVEVTTARLNFLTELFDSGMLKTQVGTVLPLSQARLAHKLLAGAPHERGRIVLNVKLNP